MERHDIVPAHLAVQAMRDNGYRNTAYAVAELIDNSIQAKADCVELLLAEKEMPLNKNSAMRLYEIAILDNGSGMDEKTLRMSLQFGNGTNLGTVQEDSIGRFGMGLPASSISQCTKVEVWSWQKGVENASYTFLDINKVNSQEISEIPKPVKKKIPTIYRTVGSQFAETGTLVVWSNLDRILWKTAEPLIKNSELIIGRLYRKFIDKDKISLRMVSFNYDNPKDVKIDKEALPNDPGYLMKKTSCPKPFHSVPMFEKDGETVEYVIKHKGREHKVKITFSLAKHEARVQEKDGVSGWLVNGKPASPGIEPGSTDHGKHAKRNLGVSLVRANRELALDEGWVVPFDVTERWWGVEISFSPALDEIFGVSNNKQYASHFQEIAQTEMKEMFRSDQSYQSLLFELENDEDSKLELVRIAKLINDRLGIIRNRVKAQTKNVRNAKKERHDIGATLSHASHIIKSRAEDGHTGTTDKQMKTETEDERKKRIQEEM
ncbi:MAG TPA: ATP-binding protein, partial [Leptospiraceae bacterium]|nr:ATP-binding protein [Leptospiraceae bacterium]